ncbi:MAG TPA: circadian clock protein KaiC [Thermoanaerobaculia bacterium]
MKQVSSRPTRSRSAKQIPARVARRVAQEKKGALGAPRKKASPTSRSTSRTSSKNSGIAKEPTGIIGFDEITGGGLPRGRSTLLVGGPGSGKTIFAMQFLVNGARESEAGILVAFEESPDRLVANFKGFGWNLAGLRNSAITFVDAHPSSELVQTGDFDLEGMLAVLGAQIRRTGARRIVFDAIDIMLALLPDHAARRREIYRLHDWLLEHKLTALITAKGLGDESSATGKDSFGFMQFMVDCAVILSHRVILGVSQRNLRVQKYRGSSFSEDEAPFVIGAKGFDVAISRSLGRGDADVTVERVSSGVERLDTMLGGGYYRGASVLITGFPGTAKTTLSGAFAEAACRRGERTVFVSFDSDGTEVVRNLTSVGIRLNRFIRNGLLRMVSARTITGSAETLMVRIKAIARDQQARCLIIDPISTLSKAGNELTAHGVAERLIDWTKADGITLVCTSLLDEMASQANGGTPLQISTLADTWIHLNYLVQAGERNRGMSIVKSRGTAHSNQVRELILSDTGVTLADIYTAGGEVLMGTLRWEKESAEQVANEVAVVAGELKRVSLDAEEAVLEVRAKSLQTELAAKKVEKTLLSRTTESRDKALTRGRIRMGELRGADVAIKERK